jgi:hypothetical protein
MPRSLLTAGIELDPETAEHQRSLGNCAGRFDALLGARDALAHVERDVKQGAYVLFEE